MGCCSNGSGFTIPKGANKTLRVTVVDSDGIDFDLTGAVGYLQVRVCDDSATAIIDKTTSDPAEGAVTLPLEGVMEFYFVPGDTSPDAVKARAYVYDVWIVTAGKRYQVVANSEFLISKRVTVIP